MQLIKRKKLKTFLLALLMSTIPMTQLYAKETTAIIKEQTTAPRLQDDFYTAINFDWLKSATIRPGYVLNSTFTELDDKSRLDLQMIFSDLIKKDGQYSNNATEQKMINLYKNYLNTEARNKQGITPIMPYLNEIKNVKTLDELTTLLGTTNGYFYNALYSFNVGADFKDSNANTVTISSTSLHLGDSDHYTTPTDTSKKMRSCTETYLNQLFMLSGYTKEEATVKVNNIFKLEDTLAPSIIGTKVATTHPNIYEAIYNIYTLDDLNKLAPNLKLPQVMKSLGYDSAPKIILQEPNWLKTFNSLYTEKNLPLFKDYLEAILLSSASSYLSEDFVNVGKTYSANMYGVQGDVPMEQKAFEIVNGVFSSELGKLYVAKHFTKEDKADVETLVKEIISTYKKRINNLDWMSPETKTAAINKLDHLNIKIGYPETWTDYSKLEIKSYTDNSSLFENVVAMTNFSRNLQLESLNKPVDKTKFLMPPQMINACYSPLCNDITFPAAILQSPYYDITRSKEANLGAIGAVIGHEITHAFDNIGARFDQDGNLKDWWTQQDYKKFEEKSTRFRQFYSKIEVAPKQFVNGDLTLGENIADVGAIACMLDIMKDIPNADYKAFFESWATVWRTKSTPEYEIQALLADPHAPGKIRTNTVLQQFEEFYKTYGITSKDKMYIKPEDRLKIW